MTEIKEPTKAHEYRERIEGSIRYFNNWNVRADKADQVFSDSDRLAKLERDREYNLFWSNIQTMAPMIYARPPVPVVTPKFKDRKPLNRTASEFLERNCVISFDTDDIDGTMKMLRDDLTIIGRGVAWVRYSEDDGDECVHYEHLHRRDFTHAIARSWRDVDWVARRGWLTHDEMKERFGTEAANSANYSSQPVLNKDLQTNPILNDYREQCGVWEMWDKTKKKVIWFTDEGPDEILEMRDPHLKIDGFFPCPEPVYSTIQRGTLIPVMDFEYYKDQLAEINDLTRKIHTLGRSLRVAGFYQAGGDIGGAIEAAINMEDDAKVMIPISSTAGLTQGSEPIIWLPIDMISQTLISMVELRRQLIDDVYQTIGMADIQRAQTETDETAFAQRIKNQNGAVRLRDKQQSLVRIGRDLVRIGAQVMIDNYSDKTLTDAAQMDLPTNADVKKNLESLGKQAKQALEDLGKQAQQMVMQAQQSGEQVDPQQAEQMFQQQQMQLQQEWSMKIKEAGETVTVDQVLDLLRDKRMQIFALDIETDSTIYPDEMAEKNSRSELLQTVMGTLPAVAQLAALGPQALALAGGILKFSLAPYRVGRELDSLVDDFVDSAPQIVEQMQAQQGDGGEGDMKAMAEAEMEKANVAREKNQLDNQKAQMDLQQKQMKMEGEFAEKSAKLQLENEKLRLSAQKQQQEFAAKMSDMDAKQNLMQAQTAEILARIGLDVRKQDMEEYKAAADIQMREVDQANGIQQQQTDTAFRAKQEGRADRAEDRSDRQQGFNEQQAMRESGNE